MFTEACYVSNIGEVRTSNEDSMLLNEVLISEGNMDKIKCLSSAEERQIYIVADGMGGHAKGETASRSVVETFKEHYIKAETDMDILKIMKHAKEGLNSLVKANRQIFGLGTTITGIFAADGRAFVFNCGDSRVYRFGGESLKRITKDHSVVEELVDSGLITEDEMRFHPRKHIITSALIGDMSSEPPEYYLAEIPLMDEDRFLLCSDGVWEGMSKEEMAGCLRNDELRSAAECLFRRTMENGAMDNISIIVLDISSGRK